MEGGVLPSTGSDGGISDRVIPEGDPGILESVCFICGGGVLVIRRMAGSEGAEKWSGWLCFLVVFQGVLFPVFTVFPPETGLFALPG